MIEKATGLAADHVFLDLEDSVTPDAKVAARATVATAVGDLDWGERVVGVRINDMAGCQAGGLLDHPLGRTRPAKLQAGLRHGG